MAEHQVTSDHSAVMMYLKLLYPVMVRHNDLASMLHNK